MSNKITITAARDIICGLALSSWVAAGGAKMRLVWDDKPENIPSGDEPWARVTIRHSDAPTKGFGNGRALVTNIGTVWVQVFTAAGAGPELGDGIVQGMIQAYRSASTDVWFRNARPQEVPSSGAFRQTNILIDFTYDN